MSLGPITPLECSLEFNRLNFEPVDFIDKNCEKRRVAKHFNKRHGDVLRAYDHLECGPEFNQRNFASVDFIDKNGDTRR